MNGTTTRILAYRGQRYHCETDGAGTLMAAQIEINAHDKRQTLRRVWHPATLSALQEIVKPQTVCHACGREL
jgi:hypothetical protein